MTLAAAKITIGQSLGGGEYSSTIKGASAPDVTTILTDITAALGAAGGTHDSTTEITTVQTDATALIAAINADVTVIWDKSTITSRNQLRAALRLVLKAVSSGYGGLSD